MMDVTASISQDVRAKGNTNNDMQKQKNLVPSPQFDSRWTLKYREAAPGLVELIKHSGVYVNADKLTECQKWSNDCKTFAGKLLTEIFTMSALSTCSWSELDKRATDILLQFVVQYGQIRHWMRTDYQCILKAMRQVMLEMKCARQKIKEEVESKFLNEEGSHKCKIVLPPEYEKHNPKWTLKYREYAPGLDELIKNSNVYVERSKLQKCKRFANDSVTLARMLLPEIFASSALSICSLPGSGENLKHRVTNNRPRLDENAITTLIKFVVEVETKSGWTETDKKCILSRIRQKLEVLRRVKLIVEGENAEDEEEEDDSEEEDCWNTKKPRFRYIPEEYDENDSRWTLKYREPAPGLVELIEHSGVYINSEKLAECKRLSNDCQTLARTLLIEIFTANALSTCKLSKKNRKCFKAYNLSPERSSEWPKPELDAHAEIILLNFVDDYALEKGWKILDFHFIESSMLFKMAQMESVYTYKEDERRRAAADKKCPMC